MYEFGKKPCMNVWFLILLFFKISSMIYFSKTGDVSKVFCCE
jgi:hypothetical protein